MMTIHKSGLTMIRFHPETLLLEGSSRTGHGQGFYSTKITARSQGHREACPVGHPNSNMRVSVEPSGLWPMTETRGEVSTAGAQLAALAAVPRLNLAGGSISCSLASHTVIMLREALTSLCQRQRQALLEQSCTP